jgi:hypothetical protein
MGFPETIEAGTYSIAGLETESALKAVERMKQKYRDLSSLFEDRTGTETISQIFFIYLNKW